MDITRPSVQDQPAAGAPGPEAACGRIRKGLLLRLFAGFYLLRWNDKLRPCQLVEMDKQAHKMIVANLLWTRACRSLRPSDALVLGQEVIEGGLFDYLFRMVVTDIKPPIFYRILENRAQYERLVHYALGELSPVLAPLGPFWDRFCRWHEDRESFPEARRLLLAAHQFASRWEFRLISPLNGFDNEMPDIEAAFERTLNSLAGQVDGLTDILLPGTALGNFANFSGQLRFQVRWTQLPRIPQTDVLGHMFLVAAMAYLFSLTVGACRARCLNNFFGGLFHDLPELLTRDIISPVKRSSSELASLIRQCEAEELARRLFAPLEEAGETLLAARLRYYLGLDADSEFGERYRMDTRSGARTVEADSFEALHAQHNRDCDDPLDGRLVKACDNLAAFLEADASIRNGVSSSQLVSARVRIRDELLDRTSCPACLQMDSLLADFD